MLNVVPLLKCSELTKLGTPFTVWAPSKDLPTELLHFLPRKVRCLTQTCFPPRQTVNDAFSGIPLKLYEPAWKLHLSALLEYHVIPLQEILVGDLAPGDKMPTVEGSEIEVTNVDPLTFNGNARVIAEDVSTSNGILHAINSLLHGEFHCLWRHPQL